MREYETYPDGADEDLPWELREDDEGTRAPRADPTDPYAATPRGWCVIVEFAQSDGRRRPPTVVRVIDDDLPSREVAHAAAERRAYEFEPPDPRSPQSREVYEEGDGFLTVVYGATSTFHFTTRVVRARSTR